MSPTASGADGATAPIDDRSALKNTQERDTKRLVMANSALGVQLNGRDFVMAAVAGGLALAGCASRTQLPPVTTAVASWPNEWAPPKC